MSQAPSIYVFSEDYAQRVSSPRLAALLGARTRQDVPEPSLAQPLVQDIAVGCSPQQQRLQVACAIFMQCCKPVTQGATHEQCCKPHRPEHGPLRLLAPECLGNTTSSSWPCAKARPAVITKPCSGSPRYQQCTPSFQDHFLGSNVSYYKHGPLLPKGRESRQLLGACGNYSVTTSSVHSMGAADTPREQWRTPRLWKASPAGHNSGASS